jgi:uncharacterized protein YjiS (DUF1127 family)
MALLDITARMPRSRVRYDLLGALQAAWHAFGQHRQDRRTLITISRMSPRLIRDMGFDPDRVYEALDGTWDEVDPASYRGMLPRRGRI